MMPSSSEARVGGKRSRAEWGGDDGKSGVGVWHEERTSRVHSPPRGPPCRSSRTASSSVSSRGSEEDERRRHYPLFTAEYARRFDGGNVPFLRVERDERQQQRFILYNEYVLLRELGKGTYAKVVLCRSLRTGECCALKIFRNEKAYREASWDEVIVLQALSQHVTEKHQHWGSAVTNGTGHGMVAIPKVHYDVLGGSGDSQGRLGRFNALVAYLPHPVHHAIVLPALGMSLLDTLRGVRGEAIRGEGKANAVGEWQDGKPLSSDSRRGAALKRGVVEVTYRGMPIDLLRSVLYQILLFLRHAHQRGIVHTDLKPENVLFECSETLRTRISIATWRYCYRSSPSEESSERANGCPRTLQTPVVNMTSTTVEAALPAFSSIRVIDLGAAEFLSECRHVSTLDGATRVFHHRIHTTHYRSVEVLLGLGWTASADMWSLGCMVPELLTGDCVFMPRDDLEHLALMQHVIGAFDAAEDGVGMKGTMVGRVFARGRHFKDFFDTRTMRLAWPPPPSSSSCGRERRASLEDARYVASQPTLRELLGPYPKLHDLCRSLLDYDPLRRITAADALQHPFFTTAA